METMTFTEWCEEIWDDDYDMYSYEAFHDFVNNHIFELVKAYAVYRDRDIIV